VNIKTFFPAAAISALLASSVVAQDHDHSGHPMQMPMQGDAMADDAQAMLNDDHSMHAMMGGSLGAYGMTRDASGTAWQPESAPMEGLHGMLDDWSTMLHGNLTGVYTDQGGPRGGDQFFSESMFMGMAQRGLGAGQLTLKAMISLDAFMGKRGYPLLLQTGETADGATPLIDRQHPHDLLMELSGTYSHPLGGENSAFLYVGYPGEPALGPVTFMHRFSGASNPLAPISHHWLDATHVTFGVVTGGLVLGDWKIEASGFKGREPDEYRWDFDSFALDSASARVSFNPTENWSLQASYGFLKSPEQLHPGDDQQRITASAIYNRLLDNGNWQTTFAWGRNIPSHGDASDAFLLESAVSHYQHTLFARVERTGKNELFEAPSPLAGQTFDVGALSLGYIYDIPFDEVFSLGLGAMGTVYALPDAIKTAYGSPVSYTVFTRLKLL
jgi:hypothetical protein